MPNPLADNVNLFRQGLNDLESSVKQLQFQRVLANANDKVRQIRTLETNEQAQREQLGQVAQDLTFQMSGLGAPASQIQSLNSSIDPDKSFRERMQLLVAKGAMGAKKPPAKEDVEFSTNVKVANNLLNDLDKTIDKAGTWESRFNDPESSGKLSAIPYQLAVTYAKIVDPTSVAREGEVQAAQKYLIPLGAFASSAVAKSQIKHMRSTIQQYQKARGSSSEDSGTQQVNSPANSMPWLTPID